MTALKTASRPAAAVGLMLAAVTLVPVVAAPPEPEEERAAGRAAFLSALRSLDLSAEQRTKLRGVLLSFRTAGPQSDRAKLLADIDAVLTPAQRDALRDRLTGAATPATATAAKTDAAASVLVSEGTAEEKERYRRAGEYAAAHAGMSVLVMKNGKVVYERYEPGFGPDRAHQLASGTKSFWGVAAACAVADGLFASLDEKASDTLSEWKNDPRRAKITVRHLLSFTSGLKPVERLFSQPSVRDRYAHCVAQPAVAEPGSVYRYDDIHLYAFGALLGRKLAARAAKENKPAEDPLAYLKRRVLDPIGSRYDRWARDAAGNPTLPYGGVLRAREWAKFGELVRGDGKWKGKQIVPAAPLRACLSPGSAANPAYGLTWWLNRAPAPGASGASVADGGDGGARRTRARFTCGDVDAISARGIYPKLGPDLVMAAGAGQQRLYVIPSADLVVVRQANPNVSGAMMGRGRMDRSFSDAAFLGLLLGHSDRP